LSKTAATLKEPILETVIVQQLRRKKEKGENQESANSKPPVIVIGIGIGIGIGIANGRLGMAGGQGHSGRRRQRAIPHGRALHTTGQAPGSHPTTAPAPPVAKAIPASATPATQPELSSNVKANSYTLVSQSRTVLMEQTQQVLAYMMGDATICKVCGHITIRLGTCYKCLNCGIV